MEPDIKKDIISLGLVKDITVEGNKIGFQVSISNPAMHVKKRFEEACIFNLERAFGKEIDVHIQIDTLPADRSPELRKALNGAKNIIAVASGKGGVGKSTVAVNIAAGLAKRGFKVGFIDADIYGPSAPIMFDLEGQSPVVEDRDGEKKIKPLESYGVSILSIGFFADASQAIVWRGPMASKAINQMIKDVHWGDLDYMILDLPPGTGDIHLTLVQNIPITGAVVVSTPQAVALADCAKGVSMFQMEAIKVPVLGIIENMSYFSPAELPNNKYFIFGEGGAKKMAAELNVPLLGEIPLVQSIREAGDAGRPAVLQDNTVSSMAMDRVIDNMLEQVAIRNEKKEPTKTVKITRS
ncbi:MAG: ATP-binding protein involved in chromosome partitioning [Sphingobacteriales bacterium]|jgi:ATP-binding protein involved in chromosome partitioning